MFLVGDEIWAVATTTIRYWLGGYPLHSRVNPIWSSKNAFCSLSVKVSEGQLEVGCTTLSRTYCVAILLVRACISTIFDCFVISKLLFSPGTRAAKALI